MTNTAAADPIRAQELLDAGDPAGAAAIFRAAAQADPLSPRAFRGLANARWLMDDHPGALEAAKQAAKLAVHDPDSIGPYIRALIAVGLVEQAIGVARGALEIHPRSPELLQCMCLALNYSDRATPEQMLEAAQRCAEAFALAAGGPVQGAAPARGGRGRVRIGYLSADLREHSVACFIEPVLAGHDRARFEVFIYSNNPADDHVSRRLRAMDLSWRSVRSLSDREAAGVIRDDELDILVELSGHTVGHRMGVVAQRPAPVQATYLGYPNTTGFAPGTVDFRIIDAVTDPPGSERSMSERALRLPGCFLCYRPPEDAPDPAPDPDRARRGAEPPVFGSFNNISKISDTTVRLWARVVQSVPGSRLVLKAAALACPWTREILRRRFINAGLAPARIEALPPARGRAEHLAAYRAIDIALDTFPYHGTTTTCEALWMGVPVVSMTGGRHAARVGASLLRAVGLPHLAAESEAGFLGAARALAADRAPLAALRASLRERVRASPLCDERAFVAGYESAIESALADAGAARAPAHAA